MSEEIINLVNKLKIKHPELRIGQIMIISAKKGGWTTDDIFYCPNEIILKGLKNMLIEGDKSV